MALLKNPTVLTLSLSAGELTSQFVCLLAVLATNFTQFHNVRLFLCDIFVLGGAFLSTSEVKK